MEPNPAVAYLNLTIFFQASPSSSHIASDSVNHLLKRDIFCWKKGQLYQTTREGQLWALEVVSNTIIIWNTIYMQKAIEFIELAGYNIEDKDKARLNPFIHDHINITGNYSFEETERILKGILRDLLPMDEKTIW